MPQLTNLEREAISAILAERSGHLSVLNDQLESVVVESRENTGGGFFSTISVSSLVPSVVVSSPLGVEVYASIEGMEYGLGLLLFFEQGRMNLLEGYTVGCEDTSTIDFEHIAFRITTKPTPWNGNVS
jgi:hypothetical protein